MTDDKLLEILETEHARVRDAVHAFRAAGVSARFGCLNPRVYEASSDHIWAESSIWFSPPSGPAVYVDLGATRARIFTIDKRDGVDHGLSFTAPTIASAVALAAENPDMRRWLGLPEPATVIETGGELYEVSVP